MEQKNFPIKIWNVPGGLGPCAINYVVLSSAIVFLNIFTRVCKARRKLKQVISELICFLCKEDYEGNLGIAISYNKLRKITNDWVTNVVRERG